MGVARARRLSRLAEELEESGLALPDDGGLRETLLEEVDRALRPAVHERRIPSSGTILEPRADPARWSLGTELQIVHTPVGDIPLSFWRRFTDGLSSWLVRRTDGHDDEWVLFERPAGSERDVVVMADVFEATIVQRHRTGVVRVAGPFGVLRWEGLAWYHEPPVSPWVAAVTANTFIGDAEVIDAMLRLAIHDLGSLGIGALLVYRPTDTPGPAVEETLPVPPPLRIRRASHLAPLRHALAQVDGAAIFDREGVLHRLGVRLVPSTTAGQAVDALGGTRHTSGLRYSHDDPDATVIVVSEDGPVTVLRNGTVLERPRA